MKVTKKYNQTRRDCWCDMVCENCGNEETYKSAYDDGNFWMNVAPEFECEKCGKSTKSMKLEPERIQTKYSTEEVI